jgi:predicted DNA-binding protein
MDGLAMRRPMGRPPLGLKMTMIRLPERTLERIDALQGKRGRRSAFIRSAIERELQRREKDTKRK